MGTDLSFGLRLSAVGGLIHAGLGDVNTAVLWKLLIGGVAGAFAGSALAAHLPSKKLRFALCVALVFIGAQLSWKSFSDIYTKSVNAAALDQRSCRKINPRYLNGFHVIRLPDQRRREK